MKARPCKSIAGLALAMAAGFASANTVTFDEFPVSATATDLGYLVISDEFGFMSLFGDSLFTPAMAQNADPSGSTLLSMQDESPLIVAQIEANHFNLVSLDLAEVPGTGGDDDDGGTDGGGSAGSVVELTYWVGGNPDPVGTLDLVLDGAPGLQTFDLGLQDVTFFTLDGVPFQLDNVVTDEVSTVAEPGTGAAMLAGLALLGSLMRRRRA